MAINQGHGIVAVMFLVIFYGVMLHGYARKILQEVRELRNRHAGATDRASADVGYIMQYLREIKALLESQRKRDRFQPAPYVGGECPGTPEAYDRKELESMQSPDGGAFYKADK